MRRVRRRATRFEPITTTVMGATMRFARDTVTLEVHGTYSAQVFEPPENLLTQFKSRREGQS